MIVVVDTNVWISGFQFGSPATTPARALNRASRQDITAISDDLEGELVRILIQRFRWPRRRVRAALDLALERAIRVQPRHKVTVCRDPRDNMFLECAAEANADVLVTGDRDLLVLGTYRATRIITAAHYIELP